jgi:hypothetical protein
VYRRLLLVEPEPVPTELEPASDTIEADSSSAGGGGEGDADDAGLNWQQQMVAQELTSEVCEECQETYSSSQGREDLDDGCWYCDWCWDQLLDEQQQEAGDDRVDDAAAGSGDDAEGSGKSAVKKSEVDLRAALFGTVAPRTSGSDHWKKMEVEQQAKLGQEGALQSSGRIETADAPQVALVRYTKMMQLLNDLTDMLITRPASLSHLPEQSWVTNPRVLTRRNQTPRDVAKREAAKLMSRFIFRDIAGGDANQPEPESPTKTANNGGGVGGHESGRVVTRAKDTPGGARARARARDVGASSPVRQVSFSTGEAETVEYAKSSPPSAVPSLRKKQNGMRRSEAAAAARVDPLIPSKPEESPTWPELERVFIEQVRKRVFFGVHLILKMRSSYQDRLGTNTGKALTKKRDTRFFLIDCELVGMQPLHARRRRCAGRLG